MKSRANCRHPRRDSHRRSHHLPRLGVLRRRRRRAALTLLDLARPQPTARLRRRARHGQESGRALVGQSRTAPRALRHRIAGRPNDLYLSPWELEDRLRAYCGCDLDQLGAVDVLDADRTDSPRSNSPRAPRSASTAPSPRLSTSSSTSSNRNPASSSPHPTRAKSNASPACCRSTASPIASARAPSSKPPTVYSESSYLAGDLRTPVIVRAAIANGVQVLDLDRRHPRASDRRHRRQRSQRRRRRPGAPRHAQQVKDRGLRLRLPRPRRRRLRRPRRARHRPIRRPAHHRSSRTAARSS